MFKGRPALPSLIPTNTNKPRWNPLNDYVKGTVLAICGTFFYLGVLGVVQCFAVLCSVVLFSEVVE